MLHCVLNRFTWSVTDESQANVLIRNDSSAGAVASGTNMKGPSQSQHECNERPAKCKPRPTGQNVVHTGQEDSVHALNGAAGATAAAAGERLRGQAENLLGNEEIGAVLELAFSIPEVSWHAMAVSSGIAMPYAIRFSWQPIFDVS